MPDPKVIQLLVAVSVALGGFVSGVVLGVRRSRVGVLANGNGVATLRDVVNRVHALEVQQAVNVERLSGAIDDLKALTERVLSVERRRP